VIARKLGDEYQDDWFWLQACRIFHKNTTLKNVGYEVEGLFGFDDVVVYYEKPNRDEFGDQILLDYFQVKYHVDYGGAFTAESLIDPKFINSKTTSLLQRVQSMQRSFAPSGKGSRFILVSPWMIHPEDPLSKIISTDYGRVRMEILFSGSPKSVFGQIRKNWSKHLGLNNEEDLKTILRPFRIVPEIISKRSFRARLDDALIAAGLKPINDELGNKYHDLIKMLHKEGRNILSKADLIEICTKENLYHPIEEEKSDTITIGIRSFSRWAENLQDQTDFFMDLVPFFDNRNIRSQSDWTRIILTIEEFLYKNIKPGKNYLLYLDTHASISFCVGSLIGMKVQATVHPIQNDHGKCTPWILTQISQSKQYETCQFDELTIGNGVEYALALSITHNILDDVKYYVSRNMPNVGKIVHAHISIQTNSSIINAEHAYQVAQNVILKARDLRSADSEKKLHLFFAAPNGLIFFLGKLSNVLGNLALYEYDFESGLLGAYTNSVFLPLKKGGI